MTDKDYNWKRFWSPREATVSLDGMGYLFDPDDPYGAVTNPAVVPFASISSNPCLVLLAEPGMGKTRTMRQEQAAIDSSVIGAGGQTLWFDLRSYGSEDRLVRNLFDSSTWRNWVEGSHHLHVFLDSLDEALLRIDTLATLLPDELQKYPVERLSLRIACRTADWPAGLEQELRRLWGETFVGVFELAPLRHMDVVEAAQTNGLDSAAFLVEVTRMQAVPLAIKPVTLNLLLNTYRRQGSFPGTQADLYRDGLRLLCDETNVNRRDARQTGSFSAPQRMLLAGRIAAVTILANRNAVWVGINDGNVPADDLTLQDLIAAGELSDDALLSDVALRETLDTGLFSSRGPDRMGWAHQTYAEYLAAWYLAQKELSIDQVMSLLIHPEDRGGKLVPQLHEVTAWLAGMVPEVFRTVMRNDPEVLLRSDVATADAADREALVTNLLEHFDAERLMDKDRNRYDRVAHPRLAEQLRPYICDRTKGFLVRRVAIDIAEACQLRSLQDDLLAIVLDPTEAEVVRINTAYAIERIGDDETKAQLKPLATGAIAGDPDDELKGCALRAVWPRHMTAADLFSVVDAPHNSSLMGAYKMFVSFELAEGLQPADLPAALEWVAKLPSQFESRVFARPIDMIFLQAWEHLNAPGVLTPFARGVLSRLEHHESIVTNDRDDDGTAAKFRQRLLEDHAKRHRLIETILLTLSNSRADLLKLVYSKPSLLVSKDLSWLVEQVQSSTTPESWEQLVFLIERVFDCRDPEHLEIIFAACEASPILVEMFRWLLFPITLASPEAEQLKAAYYEAQEQQNAYGQQLIEPPPTERIAQCLTRFEQGDLAAWWHLNRELTLEPTSTHYSREFEADLQKLPGWQAADEVTRTRMIDAAKRYLTEAGPETQ